MEHDIPARLRIPANDALQWLNHENSSNYQLTGISGAEEVDDLNKPFNIGLILCDGDRCARKQIKFTPSNGGFIFSQLELETPAIPSYLDPPEGVREGWIKNELSKNEFILLIFYRGLW